MDKKIKKIFNSPIGAYVVMEEKFLNLVSLLRLEQEIIDQKLEVYPNFDNKGVVRDYKFVGKVKFNRKTVYEFEDGEFEDESFVIIMEYNLFSKNTHQKLKGKKGRLEKWVLEKV